MTVSSYGPDHAALASPEGEDGGARPDHVRYGFYLRPDSATCMAIATIHDLLERQYGLRVAGRFMPHATVKGFFHSHATPEAMVARLDDALSGHRAFPVTNGGPIRYGPTSIVLDVHHGETGERNEPLHAVHEAVLAALLPLVRSDCAFTRVEGLAERFHAHLTLAMVDLPPWLGEEILTFIRALGPIGPPTFTADTFHLLEFRSEAWDGAWWETLTWRPLHGWRLPPVNGSPLP